MDDWVKQKFDLKTSIYFPRQSSLSSQELKKLKKKVIRLFEDQQGKVIRQRRNRKTFSLNVSGTNFYCKHYSPEYSNKLHDKLKNFNFIPGSGINEFKNLVRASQKIPVIEPVLAVSKKIAPFYSSSLLVTKEFAGIESETVIKGNDYSYQLKERVAKKAAKSLIALHKLNLVHGDYRFRNLLLKLDNNNQIKRLVVLDLDRSRQIKVFKNYQFLNDWSKFLGTWLNRIIESKAEKSTSFIRAKEEFKKYRLLLQKEYQLSDLEIKLLKHLINNRVRADFEKIC